MALVGDSPGYLQLSREGLFSPLRPPGYPAFLAVLHGVGLSLRGVFAVQGLLLCFIPIGLYELSRMVARVDQRPAFLAAALCATSGTVLWIAKRYLADPLLAVLAFLSCALLLSALGEPNRRRVLLGAGIAAAGALLVKPIFLLWPVVVGLWALSLILGGRPFRREEILWPVLPWAVVVLGLSMAMYARYGVFKVSGIGDLTISRYWAAKTRALVEDGTADDRAVKRRQQEIEPGMIEAFSRGAVAWNEVSRQGRTYLLEHPGEAARAFAHSAWRNLPRPWFPQELRLPAGLGPAAPAGKLLVGVLYGLALFGFAAGAMSRETRSLSLFAAGLFLLFCAATAISFWEGARLMLPVEWILYLFMGIAVQNLKHRMEYRQFVERAAT